MKHTLSFAILLIFAGHLQAQDLAGRWIGELYQNGIGWYEFELHLTAAGDSAYVGTSFISSERGSGTMALSATLESGVFHFQESRIKDEHWNRIGWYWCIKTGDLQLTERRDSLVLAGGWEAPGTCKPGTIRVAKFNNRPEQVLTAPEFVLPEQPPTRRIETTELLQVAEREVLVEIWDHENEDGDIASLSLNGQVVLKNHLVTLNKYPFRIALQPGKNMLVLFAENLGARPPNTAALTIHYDGRTKTVVLNSDTTKSEAIEITH